jgi:two-component system, OmpR family, sensor kinase
LQHLEEMLSRMRRWLGWSRSFYWRIAVTFVVFMVGVLVAQSLVFSYLTAQSEPSFLSPNVLAVAVAADMQEALVADPAVDVQQHLVTKYRNAQTLYVVLSDGRIGSNSASPVPDDIRGAAAAIGAGGSISSVLARIQTNGPIVSAPIQVKGELRGIAVLPPPPPGGAARAIARALSLPGTLILVAATALASVLVFGPARRRLLDLQTTAEQLGAGRLEARAVESGEDEIARVARAFNSMATDLAARDAALRASDQQRRQMIADVSHELKTPLTSMRGYLETLRMPEMSLGAEDRARYIDTIERETHRLERIVQDLLDLARLEGGGATLDSRVFALERLFGHVMDRHQLEARERQVALAAYVDPSADQIVADPDRLEQVIDNLVANALRHTPAGGRIELRAGTGEHGPWITVADSGSGISPEHLPHVFDRFYKVDASRVSGAAGSGLGLSIAKAIVERHGGSIEVTSRPGCTRFTITLPQRPEHQSTSANL